MKQIFHIFSTDQHEPFGIYKPGCWQVHYTKKLKELEKTSSNSNKLPVEENNNKELEIKKD